VTRRGLAVVGLCCLLGPSFARPGEAKRIETPPPAEKPAATEPPAPPKPAEPPPLAESSKPWYKTPVGITTLVVVHVAALAILLSGDGEDNASPSLPSPSP